MKGIEGLEVYDAKWVGNPFALAMVKHIGLRLNESGTLWVVIDKIHLTEGEKRRLADKYNFRDIPGYESMYYPARTLVSAIKKAREVSEALGIKVVVCNRMDDELYEKVVRILNGQDMTQANRVRELKMARERMGEDDYILRFEE